MQALDVEDVTSFSEWAEARGIVQTDSGVDLVAKLRNGPGYAAIQCKFHETGGTVARAEIDSFLAASGWDACASASLTLPGTKPAAFASKPTLQRLRLVRGTANAGSSGPAGISSIGPARS